MWARKIETPRRSKATNNSEAVATLFIIPNAFQALDEFLYLVGLANDLLFEQDLQGAYRLANFHPDYDSVGESHQAPKNDTNRSPYPCLYIIKEASMEYSLESPEKTEPKQVWWEKPVKYANLIMAIGTTFMALVSGDFSRLMMVPFYLGIYFTIK